MRRTIVSALMGMGLLLAPTLASAQEPTEAEALAALEEALPGTLMNNPLAPEYNVYGQDFSRSVVKAEVAGGQALRVQVRRGKPNPWEIAAQGAVTSGVKEGEVVLIAVWARAQAPDKDTGVGHVQVRLQQREAPYAGVAERTLELSEKWQLHYASGRATASYDPGALGISFNLGSHKQTIEIGQFYVMNMGRNVDMSTLPSGSIDP